MLLKCSLWGRGWNSDNKRLGRKEKRGAGDGGKERRSEEEFCRGAIEAARYIPASFKCKLQKEYIELSKIWENNGTKAREMHLDYRAVLSFIFGILDKLGSADQWMKLAPSLLERERVGQGQALSPLSSKAAILQVPLWKCLESSCFLCQWWKIYTVRWCLDFSLCSCLQ